jgi:hypothetical protein
MSLLDRISRKYFDGQKLREEGGLAKLFNSLFGNK